MRRLLGMKRVFAIATGTRLATALIAMASHLWTGSYDSSAAIQLEQPTSAIQQALNVFLRWDALYFLHIAEHGYVYEQEYAFFPLMPLVARALTATVLSPLQAVLGQQYTLLLSGVIAANVSFVLAAGALFKLTQTLFAGNRHLPLVSAIAFSLSPPTMFMSAFYTESLFALLSFAGMYCVSTSRYLTASVLWAFASATRSNGIAYCGFFAYALVLKRLLQKQPFKRLLTGLMRTVLYSVITTSGFVLVQWHGYMQFCTTTAQARPWCDRNVPLLYSFVQKEYWNNGLFAYYEFKQIPNFALAAPIAILSICGLVSYARKDWLRFWSLGFRSSSKGLSDPTMDRLAPYMYLWALLLVYCLTNMHVQVIIRFFTSLPPLYWFVAQLWLTGFGQQASTHSRHIATAVLSYFVLYGLVGIVLFAAFLPPA